MAVEVLLMSDVKYLGSEGDVVTVADGYARNYLIPRDIAAPATEATKRRLAKMRSDRREAMAEEIAAAQELAAKLEQVSCTLPVKVNEDEKMFGSIGAAEIVAAVAQHGFEFDKSAIVLDEPIRELGVYNIGVKVHSEVETTIKVWIVEE